MWDSSFSACATLGLPFRSKLFVYGQQVYNGLVWGNNVGSNTAKGERVCWHIICMGTEVDLHTPHWHGATLLHNGNRLDVAEVLPAATKTLDMGPNVQGKWMYHCHMSMAI
jgi:hypothetical protein